MGVIAGIAGSAVIVLALYALIDAIVLLFFNGSLYIAEAIMDESITTFSADTDIISVFLSKLPFSDLGGLSVTSIIDGIAYGLIILIILTGCAKSMLAPATGENADSPWNIMARALVALFARYLLFGFDSSFISWSSTGLIGALGSWFGSILSTVEPPTYATNWMSSWGSSPYAYIGFLILSAALIGSVITAAISYIERIISFALSIMVGPIAISLYANKETAGVAKDWLFSVFTQFGAIMLNLMLWTAFVNKANNLSAVWGDEMTGGLILDLAIAIAILSLIKNCEKIFNSFGLRTMPNMDSARSVTAGLAAVGIGATSALRAIPGIQSGMERIKHKTTPAIGGDPMTRQNRAFGTMGKATGNASLYDANGKMSTAGSGNALRRSFANATTFGVMAPAQKREKSAVSALSSSIQSASAGSRYGGFTMQGAFGSKATTYSGIETANMALCRGNKEGSQHFRFQSSATGLMGETVATNGKNRTGIYAGSRGEEASDSLLIGVAKTPGGQEVKGFFGNGVTIDANGISHNMGDVFIPTGGNNEKLAVGSAICVDKDSGECVRVKDSFYVDESGHLGYTTEPMKADSFDEKVVTEPFVGKETSEKPVSSVIYGSENIMADTYDPTTLEAEPVINQEEMPISFIPVEIEPMKDEHSETTFEPVPMEDNFLPVPFEHEEENRKETPEFFDDSSGENMDLSSFDCADELQESDDPGSQDSLEGTEEEEKYE